MTNDYTIQENIEMLEGADDRLYDYKEYTIEARDPYGFFHVIPKKGPAPEFLNGAYTSLAAAQEAIDHYLGRRVPNNQNIVNNKHREALGLKKEVV